MVVANDPLYVFVNKEFTAMHLIRLPRMTFTSFLPAIHPDSNNTEPGGNRKSKPYNEPNSIKK